MLLRAAAARLSPSARRLPVAARLSLAPLSASRVRARTRPLALRTLATGASLALALGTAGDAWCAPWSADDDKAKTKTKPKTKDADGDEDALARALEQLRALAGEALAAVAALAPGGLGQDALARVDAFLASGQGGQVSWGLAMGVCSGFALKKVSKVGALALGSLFVAMQCASYAGYVDVDYRKLERDVVALLDLNQDGQFDTTDMESLYKSVMKVLEFSLPAGSGYAVGFLVGFRAG